MKLIDRYIARQVLVTALFAISVLSLVLVLGNIFKQLLDLLINHDVPIEYILSFISYILPFSLTFTIPWGFLTAVLLVFGKLSAENELIALRSVGLSLPRLCLSLAFLAVISTGLCLWINLSVAPRAQAKMKAALFQIATSNPIAMFGSDEIIDEFPGKKIYVEKKEGTVLRNILMYDLGDKGEPISVVHAREGTLRTDLEGRQEVLLELKDARYEQRDTENADDFMRIRQGITMDRIDLPISLRELFEKNKRRRGLSQMTVTELLENKEASRKTAAKVEINKRFSFSMASLAFALVGVPLAITAHRKETSIGFFFSLILAFIYFLFILFADAVRDKPQFHPDLLIWFPNVLFVGLGIWLFTRMARR